MITSNQNNKIKRVYALINKTKARKKEGKFVVEGKKILEETPQERIEEVFVTEDFVKNEEVYLNNLSKNINITTVSNSVFNYMSDSVTPQGILGIVDMLELDNINYNESSLIIAVENIQDPGNIGTIIRTADAVKATLILSKGTVDIYNPKVIRATMGSIYRVPILTNVDIINAINKMKANNINVYAAHLQGDKYHYQLDLKKPTCFLIGNEGNGLSKQVADQATEYIKIPILGQTESLNASIATGVLLYEAIRQRMQ